MDNKSLLKRHTIAWIYIINTLMLCFLLPFVNQHFAIDSYGVAGNYEGHLRAFISNFRFIGAAFIGVWCRVFDPVVDPLPDMTAFILMTAVAVTLLSWRIYRLAGLQGKLYFAVIDLSVLISITNVFIADILMFPECIIPLTGGILFCFFSLYIFFGESDKRIRFPASSVLLIMSTACFQQFLTVFAVCAFLMTALSYLGNKENSGVKDILLGYLGFVVFMLISAVLYYLIGIGVQRVFDIPRNIRSDIGSGTVIDNIVYYLKNHRSVLGGKGLFKTNVLRRCFEVLFVLWGVSAFKFARRMWHESKCKTIIILLSFIPAYASSYAVGIISVPGGVRVIFGLFSVFALFGVSAMVFAKSKKMAYCLLVLMSFVWFLNIYKNTQRLTEQIALNAAEQVWAQQVVAEIETYEKENGVTIERVFFGHDPQLDYGGSIKGKIVALDDYDYWGCYALLRYASGGREFDVEIMSPEEMEALFLDKDWKVWDPKEQTIFKENGIWVCLY